MRVAALIGKELRTFARDAALLFVVAFLFLIHPYQSASEVSLAGIRDYPIAVYDLDRTQASAAFVERLRPPYFSLRRLVRRDREIETWLDREEAFLIVVIPEGYSRRLHGDQPASIQVLSDGTYSTTSQRATAYIQAIAAGVEAGAGAGHGRGEHPLLPVVEPRVRMRYNPGMRADWPQSLDMVLMGVTIMSMLLPAAFMVREKEQGTIEQLLVSPVRPWEIIVSKITAMMGVTTVAMLGGLGMLVWTLDLPIRGSVPLFLAATALTVFSMSGISLLLATVARTLPSAMLLVFVLIIPLQFLSGSFTPVEAMPTVQAWLTLLSPQRYYLTISYGILLKGAAFNALWREFAGLALVGVALVTFGVRRFLRQFG